MTRVLPRLHRAKHFLGAGHDDVAAQHKICTASGNADGVDFVRRIGNADMAVDRAAFLREARPCR